MQTYLLFSKFLFRSSHRTRVQVLETGFNETHNRPDAKEPTQVNDRQAESEERPDEHLLVRLASIDLQHKLLSAFIVYFSRMQ